MVETKKICFILCSNNEFLAQECQIYIKQLYVPDGYEVDILIVRDADSMCSGYNRAMSATDAKFKVYLHQDVLIVNRNFIVDMLELFQKNPDVGMIGMVGNSSLTWGGGVWSDGSDETSHRVGTVYMDLIYKNSVAVFDEIEAEYQEVIVVDGLLIATQYDIPWREDLFGGWDLYDCSQSIEFWKAGYKVVVPHMDQPWCLHDNDIVNLENYDKWHRIFVDEYGHFFKKWREGGMRL